MSAPKGMAQLRALAASAETEAGALEERVSHGVDIVAEAMQAIHGGTWKVRVSHRACLVMISRDFVTESRPMSKGGAV